MAGDDPKFTGQVFGAIDYPEVIGSPVWAAIQVQQKALAANAKYILDVGFTEDENGVKKAINVDFDEVVKNADGTERSEHLTMPLIALIDIPNVQVIEGKVSLDIEVNTSASMKENIDAGGEIEGEIGWGVFSVSLKAKASYSKENTRSSDTRAKQHVELTFGQCPPAEGVQLLLERFRNNSQTPALPAPVSV